MSAPAIRPMTLDDVPVAEAISDDAFLALDETTLGPADPPPARRGEVGSARWIARTRSFVATDPDGCWVAEQDDLVVGFATSIRRDDVWCLATFAVRPGLQGTGVGRSLLEAAERHGAGCGRGLLAASVNPRALRRYHRAGFRLHPQVVLRGTPDDVRRTELPPAGRALREGTDDDLDWMDALDRTVRGGGHGPDRAWLAAEARLLVADDRSGYVYAEDGRVSLLAAEDDAAATDLLAAVIAGASGAIDVDHVTGANDWAIRLGLDVGLRMSASGYLGTRAMPAPAPYIPQGSAL